MCSLRPLDTESLRCSIQKTHRCLVVEEGWPVCGMGSEIIALGVELAFDALDAPPVRLTGRDIPLPYAKNLEELCVPHVQDVVKAAQHLCQGMG